MRLFLLLNSTPRAHEPTLWLLLRVLFLLPLLLLLRLLSRVFHTAKSPAPAPQQHLSFPDIVLFYRRLLFCSFTAQLAYITVFFSSSWIVSCSPLQNDIFPPRPHSKYLVAGFSTPLLPLQPLSLLLQLRSVSLPCSSPSFSFLKTNKFFLSQNSLSN